MKSNELNKLINNIDKSVQLLVVAEGDYELVKARNEAVKNIDKLYIERLRHEVRKETDLRPEKTIVW